MTELPGLEHLGTGPFSLRMFPCDFLAKVLGCLGGWYNFMFLSHPESSEYKAVYFKPLTFAETDFWPINLFLESNLHTVNVRKVATAGCVLYGQQGDLIGLQWLPACLTQYGRWGC